MSIGSLLILSLASLGCKAIFLLGGKSREDSPLAMFLRSGDAVLMAGEARECFHGEWDSLTYVWYCLFLIEDDEYLIYR